MPSSSRAPPHSPGAAAKLPLRLQFSCSDSQDITAETAVQSQGAGSTGSRQRRWQRLCRTWLEPSFHQCSPRKHPATLEFSENSTGWAVDVSPGASITSLYAGTITPSTLPVSVWVQSFLASCERSQLVKPTAATPKSSLQECHHSKQHLLTQVTQGLGHPQSLAVSSWMLTLLLLLP